MDLLCKSHMVYKLQIYTLGRTLQSHDQNKILGFGVKDFFYSYLENSIRIEFRFPNPEEIIAITSFV